MKSILAIVILCLVLAIALGEPTGDKKRSGVIPRDTLPTPLVIDKAPLGVDLPPPPKDNSLTPARVGLGRKLFFDPILSGDQTIACASCHQPEHGFSGGVAQSKGIGGHLLSRRAPTLFNRALGKTFFWDGRENSLESQALRPIEDPKEMGANVEEVIKRLRANAAYREQFKAAYDEEATPANLAKALASFERVLLRGDSSVDRFRRLGQHDALNARERQGLWIYESKGQCWRCHGGNNFTDEKFHNTGVGWGRKPQDLGRFQITKKEGDQGKFKTPTLRGVVLTGPYMHDGSLKTLEEVVEYYNQGGQKNPHLDPFMAPLKLSTEEVHSLVAFLKAL